MRHRVRPAARGPALLVRVLVAAALVACTAACGSSPDVDGDLVDDWPAMAAPAGFSPEPATCHLASFAEAVTREAYEQIDCTLPHRTETVYVGSYPDPAAKAARPPAAGSAGARATYRECDLKTAAYVGAPWRTGRLWVGVVHPTPAAWTGGARWFRCDVLEVSSIEDDGGLVQRSGTLKGALRSVTSPLRLACYAIKLDAAGAITTMPASECASRHNAEFVGVWQAGDRAFPKDDAGWKPFHDGCRQLVAAYVGVPVDPDLEFRAGVVSLPGGEDVWAAGDHAVRCYLWVDASNLTSSLRDRGAAALPIQYE